MTTTAYDDQFSAEPEPVHQPYDVAAILRKNIADLEKEIQRQKERAEKAEAELNAAREQEPVAVVKYKTTGGNVGLSWIAVPTDAYYPREGEQLYTRPIPAPVVPTDAQIHAAYRVALGQSIRERDMPEIRKFAIALLQSAGGGK